MKSVLNLVATRAAIAAQGGTTHVRFTITPPEIPHSKGSGRPVALVLVADRSGSMGDAAGSGDSQPTLLTPIRAAVSSVLPVAAPKERRSKMSVLRDAAERLIDTMRDQDRFGLITFSDVAQRDLPLLEVGRHRSEARAAIRALKPDASTNLQDGLQMGIAQFDAETLRTHICKMLVITDGLANVGVSSVDGLASIVAPAAQAGITVSTIGVGLEYNSAILGALGRAGNGDYSHIEHAVAIDGILQRELQAATEVRLRGVEVVVDAGAAAIGENLNSYTQIQTANGVRVLLGDLPRARSVWFEITTPVPVSEQIRIHARMQATAADDVPEQAEASLTIQVTTDIFAIPEDAALVKELTDLLRAQGIGAATELIDSGNVAAGQQRAHVQQAVLASVANMYRAAANMPVDQMLNRLANAPGHVVAANRSMNKRLAAEAYAQQRGQANKPEDETQ